VRGTESYCPVDIGRAGLLGNTFVIFLIFPSLWRHGAWPLVFTKLTIVGRPYRGLGQTHASHITTCYLSPSGLQGFLPVVCAVAVHVTAWISDAVGQSDI
jgi:hypothetical protein